MLVANMNELPLELLLNLVERLDRVLLWRMRRPEIDGILSSHAECGVEVESCRGDAEMLQMART